VFRSEPSADLMVQRVVADMVANGVKTVGFIGFSDSWGEVLHKALTKAAEGKITIVASERYGRADPSVQAQVLKVISAKPDAVFVGASGTPAAMPQITLRERGFKGRIYQSHGVTSKEFLRVGGKNVEGALIPVGPVLVAEQLPDSHPTKKNAVAFVQTLEAKYGPDSRSTFAGATWDAWLLLQNAIAGAQKAKVKAGTPEFRAALRDGIEKTSKLVGTNGVVPCGRRPRGLRRQRDRDDQGREQPLEAGQVSAAGPGAAWPGPFEALSFPPAGSHPGRRVSTGVRDGCRNHCNARPGRRHQRGDRAAGAGAGAGVCRHPGHLHPPGRVSRLGPHHGGPRKRPFPATVWLLVGCGVLTLAVDGFSATGRAASAAPPVEPGLSAGAGGAAVACRSPSCPPGAGADRPGDRRADGADDLPGGLPAGGRGAGAGAADRLGGGAPGDGRPGLLIFGPEGSRTQPSARPSSSSVR
jgi:SOS-response transcriptional repressor LexA